jgi:hypothetical protein
MRGRQPGRGEPDAESSSGSDEAEPRAVERTRRHRKAGRQARFLARAQVMTPTYMPQPPINYTFIPPVVPVPRPSPPPMRPSPQLPQPAEPVQQVNRREIRTESTTGGALNLATVKEGHLPGPFDLLPRGPPKRR